MIATGGTWQKKIRVSLLLTAVLAAGFWMGNALRQPTVARADVRGTRQREAFRSGGARSETVLREIAATLKRIDRRLERMERAVVEQPKP